MQGFFIQFVFSSGEAITQVALTLIKGHCRKLGHHQFDKLHTVDLAITISVSFAYHLVNVQVAQSFAQIGHINTSIGKENVAES